MFWSTAITWAASLVYGGYSDWRLATNTPINGSSFNINVAVDGSTDMGHNISSQHSELAYMYHVNLGLKDYVDITGAVQSNFGVFGNGITGGQNNVGLVNNLQGYMYWSSNDFALDPQLGMNDFAWAFNTNLGNQNGYFKYHPLYAWAVRSGDVAAVPVPAAAWLFGSGLIGLLSFNRSKNKTANLITA